MYLANEIQSPSSEWPSLDNWLQHCSRHQQNIFVLFTLFTSFVVPKTIGYLLTQKVHLAPDTQQAEQAGFARAESDDDMPVNFP
jgi:hypothetical protein